MQDFPPWASNLEHSSNAPRIWPIPLMAQHHSRKLYRKRSRPHRSLIAEPGAIAIGYDARPADEAMGPVGFEPTTKGL